MERHFDQELEDLKQEMLRMAALTEQNVAQALKALVQRDTPLARRVDAGDSVLDHLQMEIDEKVIELIALRQPAARDLRFLIVVMKIAAELERVGDQAVNIARRAEELNRELQLKPLIDIPHIADIARGMIRDVLDAFVYARPDEARRIIERDTEADNLEKQLNRELVSYMVEDPHTIGRALNLMGVAHSLERIADHATNIAEEVVYLYEARDIRHQASATSAE